ncbi:MAG: hypothetical protein Q9192_003459 [Flavoplaca navasiana]
MSSTWLTNTGLQEVQFTASSRPTLCLLSLVIASSGLMLAIVIRYVNKNRAESQFERAHACGAPRPLHYKWPFALDLVMGAFRIIAENQALQWFVQIFDKTGPTFEQNVLGVKGVNTIEPEKLEVEEHTEYLVNCIPTGEFVDLQTLFFRFTFDTTTFLLFGKSMNSLQATLKRDESKTGEARFSETFHVSQDFLFRRGRLGDLYWLIGGKEFRRQCSIVHEFINEAMQGALSTEYQKDKAADVHSFLDALIQQTRDPKVLRDQLLNVMLAGRDTTACCLTWTFRLLAQHPNVLAKLRHEIGSVVGLGMMSRLPDRNDLKRMKYLNLVLKEGYSVYVMHRLKKLYGEDTDSFRPERWDPDVKNAVNLKNIGWGYLPFNGGPRICLGQEFAILEAGYVVVRIVQKFRNLKLGLKDKDVVVGTENQEVTLVVASTNGCRVKAFE